MNSSALTDVRAPVYTPGVKRPPNLKALTSVRFFAALHVAMYHLVRPWSRWGPLEGVFSSGYLGVSFFFVLSGFILTYSHAQEYEAGRGRAVKFWVARLARIYPVYLLAVLFAGIFERSELHGKHLVAYLADIFVVQSWNMRLINFFNPPAWTISVEAFFYLVFPFLLLRLRPTTPRRALAAMVTFYVLAMALPAYCLWRSPANWTESGADAAGGLSFLIRRLPLTMLPEFLAGISLGWLFLRFRPGQRTLALLAWSGTAGMLAALYFSPALPYVMLHNGLLMPLVAMILLGLGGENGLSRLLSHPVLVLLGEASFSLYLFHVLFEDSTRWWYGPADTIHEALWKLAVLLPVTVLLHLYVERPCRGLILDWWRRRHPQDLAVVRG